MVLQRPKSFPSATICKRPDLHLVSSSLAFRKKFSSILARQHMVLSGVMSIPKGGILLREPVYFYASWIALSFRELQALNRHDNRGRWGGSFLCLRCCCLPRAPVLRARWRAAELSASSRLSA